MCADFFHLAGIAFKEFTLFAALFTDIFINRHIDTFEKNILI